MIQTESYWNQLDELTNDLIQDINCEMTKNNVDAVEFETPIDDVYKVYIDDENKVHICKAASSLEYLYECELNTILAIAEAINNKFN